jgi:hypothetical protein
MSEQTISPLGQLRRRLMDACMDICADGKPSHLEGLCRTLEALALGMRKANGSAVNVTLQKAGNLVALPGVDLEAACRAQRRRRKAVRS